MQEEFGLLSLEYDENYCMGGPGMVLSHTTLSKVAPHVKDCLRNLYTTHEEKPFVKNPHRKFIKKAVLIIHLKIDSF